jgi:murein L,D-transpeptidase YafK
MHTTRRRLIIGLLSGWILCPAAMNIAAAGQRASIKADLILVMKAERRLYLLAKGEVIRTYPIRLGPNPVGPKIFELDGRTPEGRYVIDGRKQDSAYYRSLHISYPSAENRARAEQYGISPGGNIRIHGTPGGSGLPIGDWTDGCIAVSNTAMREIWNHVDVGTPIEIKP